MKSNTRFCKAYFLRRKLWERTSALQASMGKVLDPLLTLALTISLAAAVRSDDVQPLRSLRVASYSPQIERTYLFSNANWWETPDHQLTTSITLLTLGFNISAITVLPDLVGADARQARYSLLGDFYDMYALQKVQKTTTLTNFMKTADYTLLQTLTEGKGDEQLSFPKSSQALYEMSLEVLSTIGKGSVDFGMPNIDLESTGQYCNKIPGTVHVSANGKVRYIFLDNIHFYHACTEAFMPWWYDVRMHILPREEYRVLAAKFSKKLPAPLTFVHVRDALSGAVNRSDQDIYSYARQITNGLRRAENQNEGAVYFEYIVSSASAAEVADLLQTEFAVVKKCLDLYLCGHLIPADEFEPKLEPALHRTLFETNFGPSLISQALAMEADHFIGNIYSPYSRSIALHRKLKGKTYDILKGFAEMKRIERWRL